VGPQVVIGHQGVRPIATFGSIADLNALMLILAKPLK